MLTRSFYRIRRAPTTQFYSQNRGPKPTFYCRAPDEAFYYQPSDLASRFFCHFSVRAQCVGGNHEVRRPRVLHGVVEQPERWHVLEDLEQAYLPFHEEAYLRTAGGEGLEFKRGKRVGICVQRRITRAVSGSTDAQYSWYVRFICFIVMLFPTRNAMLTEPWF